MAARGGLMERPGIFVKSVVAGSAASRDGRLGPGDQLLQVEGVSLCGRSQVSHLIAYYEVKRTDEHITGFNTDVTNCTWYLKSL